MIDKEDVMLAGKEMVATIAVRAMAMLRLAMLGPSSATTIRPRIRLGKDNSTSIVCMMKRSDCPPT